MAVVLPVDREDLEPGRERLDLAEEVLGREPPLSEGVGQRVRRRRQRHPRLGEPCEQGRHEHRVAGVVELELVDAHQPVPLQRLHRLGETKRPDEVGELDERPKCLRSRGGVPEAGQQVRLADAEAPVEVDPLSLLGFRAPPAPPPATASGTAALAVCQPRGILLEAPHGGTLARLLRVGAIGGEPLRVEARRWDELADQPLAVQPGLSRGDRRWHTVQRSEWHTAGMRLLLDESGSTAPGLSLMPARWPASTQRHRGPGCG